MSATSVLRANPNFRRYWTADMISTLGSQVSAIAVPLLALTLVGGGLAKAGLIGTCALIVRLAFRLPAGQWADRFDRRWLMLATDLIRLVFIGSIPVAAGIGVLGFGQLLVVAVVDGIASAVFSAAAGIAVRDVVSDDEMTDALSGVQASGSSIMLIGPVVGGFLFGIDRILPFTVDAISYALSAVLLLGITVRPPEPGLATERDRRVTAGLRWLRGQPQLLWVLAFAGVINLAGSALEIGIVITLRGQGETGSTIGVVMAFLGAGSIIGAVCAPRLIALLPAGPLFLVTGVMWAAGFGVLATGPGVPVVCAVLLVLLLFTPAGMIMLGKAVMLSCPRDMLGRVNTAIGTSLMGLATLGPLLISATIESAGVAGAWSILAGLSAFAAVVTALPLMRLTSLVAADSASVAGDSVVAESDSLSAGADELEVLAHLAEQPSRPATEQ